jgi:hypothetical protein
MSPLFLNGHAVGGPSLHHRNRLAQKISDLFPSFKHFWRVWIFVHALFDAILSRCGKQKIQTAGQKRPSTRHQRQCKQALNSRLVAEKEVHQEGNYQSDEEKAKEGPTARRFRLDWGAVASFAPLAEKSGSLDDTGFKLRPDRLDIA